MGVFSTKHLIDFLINYIIDFFLMPFFYSVHPCTGTEYR